MLAHLTLVWLALVTGSAQEAAPEYRNVDYGYAVRLPKDIKIEVTEPPAPNHGFGVHVTPDAYVWADASYAEAAGTLGEAVAETRALLQERCRETRHRTTGLGTLPAVELVLRCRSRDEAHAATIRNEVIAFRHGIRYSIALERSASEAGNARLERTFRDLIEGFTLIPRSGKGSVCIAPIQKGEPCGSGALQWRFDDDRPVTWSSTVSVARELDQDRPHRVVVSCGAKPQQSFTFRFSEFRTEDLCLFINSFYQTANLWDGTQRAPWCKCR